LVTEARSKSVDVCIGRGLDNRYPWKSLSSAQPNAR